MRALKPKPSLVLILLAVFALAGIAAKASEDSLVVAVGPRNELLSGTGSGYNAGQWYSYPSGWHSQWFNNAPYDAGRKMATQLRLSVEPLDTTLPSRITITYGWSTPQWSALGSTTPPLPGVAPEGTYIQRHVAFQGYLPAGAKPIRVEDSFEIRQYNPQWLSVDVHGENFVITDGWVKHESMPRTAGDVMLLQQQPPECKPTRDEQGCEKVTCPITGDTCVPTKIRVYSKPGAPPTYKVLSCACQSPNLCHVAITSSGSVYCTGGCPANQQCEPYGTKNADGSVDYECRCTGQPQPTEACCLPNGECVNTDAQTCRQRGGEPQGTGTKCLGDANNNGIDDACEEPTPETVACCLPNGQCVNLKPDQCMGQGGTPLAPGSQCSTPQACCLPDGTCIMTDPQCCRKAGGTPQSPNTDCKNVNCPQPLEACCLPDGTCTDATANDCRAKGGTPQGPGTNCKSVKCGMVENDTFGFAGRIELDVPGLGLARPLMSGQATQRVYFEGDIGRANDDDGNGRDEVQTELVMLSLTGVDPLLGQVKVGLHPTKPSLGQMEERANNTPGMLDLPPFTPTGTADSFFDVFFEVELPDVGLTLYGQLPKRLLAVLTRKNHGLCDTYQNSEQTPLVDASGKTYGFLGPVRISINGPCEACCLSDGTCIYTTKDDCANRGGTAKGEGTDCSTVNCLPPGECDWNAGDPHKMHWPQLPDLSPTGMDVSVYYFGLNIGDDFLCTATGPVTDIHLWGSFKNDILPKDGPGGLTFYISIWSNAPADADKPWSRPQDILWSRTFGPGEYTVETVYEGVEAWYNPRQGIYTPADHKRAYQYNFCIDDDPFVQQEGTIYWLLVQCSPAPPTPDAPQYQFGWKTTSSDLHWNDDAVWFEPMGVDNMRHSAPLKYPDGHPLAGRTLDLAFVITGREVPPQRQACCLPDGTCIDTTVNDCLARGGRPQGPGTNCSTVVCLPPGGCEWNTGDPHKMHFPQLPDLQGWDVDVTAANLVADDWKCSETGQVRDIHFWYSWQGDKIGIIDRVHASIYSNIPAGDSATRYSVPGKLLWERVFGPDELYLRDWGTGNQGFITAGQARPNDHKNIYQCNICNITDPFTQEAGQIYWLILSVTIRDPVGTHIGWKTSLDHFEDDAVYDAGGRWLELRDPRTGSSLDLAFVITGQVVPIPGIKWAQRPEIALCNMLPGCFFGWNELSIYGSNQIVADDWLCSDDRPVTDIHWWGSFKGWASDKAPPQMPDGFHITIWTDVPAVPGTTGFSHPGKVIWQTYCKNYTYKFVGWDVDPHNMAPPWEATFYFEYDLPEAEWFWQNPSAHVYWISIAADYSKPTEVKYPWGWKTRRRDPTSTAPDDAVIIFKPTNPAVGDTFQAGEPIYWPTPDRSWDMAFVLTTAEEQPECDWNPSDPHKMHHPQLPDLSPTGMDVDMAITGLADDFKCAATGPINDIHFWGSFANDKLPKAGPGSLTFQISIYADSPAAGAKPWSTPGELLFRRKFAPGEYSVRKVSEGPEDWYDPATGLYRRADHKQAYQYNFCIKNTPFIQERGKIYWLQVEDIPPADLDYTFGWKTTTRELRWNDDAVFGQPDLGWQPLTYPAGHEFKAETLNLAFVITGEEVPECDWNAGDPHKMHWPQLPDLSDKGIDVDMFWATLADDFKCTASGPIKDIHFWGSFADDILPAGGPGSLAFKIAIHADIPTTTAKPWSTPGEVLWSRTFEPSEYTVRQVHEGPEDWYDPATGLYQKANHKNAYQYNFCIEVDPFVQQEGKVYWLAIKDIAPANAGYTFGWKTTAREHRWNDDAAFLHPNSAWLPMTYPDGHAYKGATLDLAFVITGGEEAKAEHDLGDAPDSSNSLGVPMTAYPKGGPPGVQASFPTVYQAGSPPYGPIHLQPRAVAYLGSAVSLENEADIGPDEDGISNIVPPNDSPDLDKADDGVQVPLALPYCEQTRFKYKVTVVPLLIEPPPLYVNVWLDWNRDGDWNDILQCVQAGIATNVPEWAVQNQLLQFVTSGTYDVTTPQFICWHPPATTAGNPIWMRITLSEKPWGLSLSPVAGAGGDGPAAGYQLGETEDYYFVPEAPPAPQYDFGDAPDPKYPTLLASNGARHLIGGPWFDTAGQPDPEPDGQPDLRALGDDNNGIDDEDGVEIPPLIQGHTAALTVHVNGGGGNVRGWIDFDHDGIWQIDERVYNGVLPNGTHIINVPVPADAAVDGTFARFRISSASGLGPAGEAPDGEVEDYLVEVKAPPPDIEWPQWPDLTRNGMNIRVDASDGKLRTLADDFKCTSYKKITDVHLWGSWRYDRKGVIKRIHLSIHGDDPAGAGGSDHQNRFSQPDQQVLWAKDFGPGQFTETLYHELPFPGEWWWDPVTGELIPGGDRKVWQIDIYISPADAFQQKGSPDNPVIYWLDVQVDTENGQFGWKTRQWPEHYMDDAVWDVGSELPRLWKELCYPQGHPYYGLEKDSLDMAFVITGREEAPPPPPVAEHTKWSQPPIETEPKAKTPIYCGWDELSFAIRPSSTTAVLPTVWNIVADDFRCLGSMPVTSVHWWGSYEGWDGSGALAVRPTFWRIGFWSNVPANPLTKPGHSYPKKLLWLVDVPANRVSEERAGFDRFAQRASDTCFRYYVKFEPQEYFWQQKYVDSATGDDVFWISITAIYPPVTIPFQQWGWKTRPQHWMDDAVKFVVEGDLPLGYVNDLPLIFTPIEAALCGQQESFDMAFELDTDPTYVKWEQAFAGIRNWAHYADEESMALALAGEGQTQQLQIRRLVADDWPCEQITPITAAVWWGSYIGYRYKACDCPLMAAPLKPDYFLLSIWTDVRPAANAPFSRPGEKIWEYKADNYDQVLVGYDKQPETVEPGQTPGYEPVFRYSVRLPRDKWFCQKDLNNIYWFSVVAVYAGDKTPVHPWGWTNHQRVDWQVNDPTVPPTIVRNDDAVAGYLDTTGATAVWKWQELYDQTGVSADMSFMLFTEPGCFPCTYSTYADWLALGKPNCWCEPPLGSGYQCDGDADGVDSGGVNKYRVFTGDLNLIVTNWKKKAGDATLNPCADIDHKDSGGINKYRVFTGDLARLVANWKKKDAQLPGDCPRPE